MCDDRGMPARRWRRWRRGRANANKSKWLADGAIVEKEIPAFQDDVADGRRLLGDRQSFRRPGCVIRSASMDDDGHVRRDGASATQKRAIARRRAPARQRSTSRFGPACRSGALLLRGGGFGMPDGSCVRASVSDETTVLRVARGIAYIPRVVTTAISDPQSHEMPLHAPLPVAGGRKRLAMPSPRTLPPGDVATP